MSWTRRISNVSTPMTTSTTTRPRPTAIHHRSLPRERSPAPTRLPGDAQELLLQVQSFFLPSPPERLANGQQVTDDVRCMVNGGLQIPQWGRVGPACFQPPNRFLRLHPDVAGEDQDGLHLDDDDHDDDRRDHEADVPAGEIG